MATRSIDSSALPDAGFPVELVDRAGLAGVRDAWKALAARAAEPNVFYDPDFALPAIEALGFADRIRALLVRDGEGALTGVFPFTARRRWGVPISVGEAFIHPYAMSSAPLVDDDTIGETLSAFFGWLEQGAQAPGAFLFRFLPQDGPLHEAIVAEAGAGLSLHGAYERAVLDCEGLDAGYLGGALGTKRKKEYARQRRRLAEHGEIGLTSTTAPGDVRAGVGEFLTLESSGWKGRRGTAAALSEAATRMFEAIAEGLGASGQMRVDALRLDGKPVAMALSCGVGGTWWLWKIAYDEDYAPYSPGVLLVLDMTLNAIAADDPIRYDSCALPGIAMIERLWRQRRPYADALIAPARLGMLRPSVPRLESLRRQAEAFAKQGLLLIGRR